MKTSSVPTLLLIGAGQRGLDCYGAYVAAHPEEGRIVAVAEPVPALRQRAAQIHHIPAHRVFRDWREALFVPRCADAVLICTQDKDHVGPTLAAIERGYHVLLEKPMATTEDECRAIIAAVRRAGIIFGICHVLRYTPYARLLRSLLDHDAVGEIINVRHLEPVGWWHMAHSFVRGNWRRTDEATFMLLAKSCHDFDFINFVVQRRCRRVASFGALSHFRREHQPPGAADRCYNCPSHIEQRCPYSALRLYKSIPPSQWPASVLSVERTPEAIDAALRSGPYGRCVYACDNDVVDHQDVLLEFDNGCTVAFTMSAFTPLSGRHTHIMGTHGELRGDGEQLIHTDFVTGQRTVHTPDAYGSHDAGGGHGGGDAGLMRAFLAAVREGNPAHLSGTPEDALEAHLIAFAAERARLSGTVQPVSL